MQGWPRVWLALVAFAPLLLAVGRFLPAEGAGLALRLAGAAACVLLLPGACLVRALKDRGPLGLQLAAALAWSLVGIFAALAVAFAVGAPLGLVLALVGSMSLVALAFSLRRAIPWPERSELLAVLVLGLLGVGLAGALWSATETIGGSLGASLSDALFHLGRIRKLDEGGSLDSIHVLNELEGGDVHPGYAFPLWHAALALVARIAGVDATLVVLYLPAMLTPLAILLAYAAGGALFRSRAGGIATALGWLALAAFPFGGVGALQYLGQPGGASRFLLLPALLALVFAFVDGRRVAHLAGAAAAAFGLAVVHPTYVVFAALLLAGFLLARAVLTRGDEVRLIGAGLAAAVLPGALYVAWLAQFVDQTRVRPPVRFTQQVEEIGSAIRLSADQLAWGGGTKVVALATVPLALLAAGRRWAAYVLGATAALGLVALVPPLFDAFADAISLSQAVRVGSFLPLPFALAGAAVLAGRLGLVGAVLSFTAGLVAELAFRSPATGAGWVMWAAAIASAAGLGVLGMARRRRVEERRAGGWAALSAAAFAVPAFVAGFASYEHWEEPDPYGLTPGLTVALREHVEPLAVVLAPSATSYRVAGYAPVRVVVGPPGHVFDSGPDYDARAEAVHGFFLERTVGADERTTVLRRYGVSWVVVDRTRGMPALPGGLTRVYGDARYVLYRVDGRQEPA